ncbi:type VI secretion system contractile sheath large subunit [Enterobacter asburiae]|uniref:type VI secretion system contractile sheath large subunit n=2 Tax=Enterobacter cloacae complex TaxID=354276 RepID=UPI002A826344|nr:type VI secretion system contractile sheath large subunit [Enterobacter asburiae]
MADSFQNEVPKARINLKLDLHTGGASKKMELPLKLLVAGDFSNGQESAQISEREKVNITKNNFDSVLSEYSPKLNLTVKNTLSEDGGEDSIQLTFQSMKDFTPEQVAAQISAAAHMPFIGSAGPKFFLKESMEDVAAIKDIGNYFDRAEYIKWKSFRDTDDARYIGLVMPRVLGRLPYGPDTVPVRSFNYVEEVKGPDHDKYLWTNASFAFASNMVRSFINNGWCVQIRGPQAGGAVQDLPIHLYDLGTGNQVKIPSEVMIPETREFEFANLGFIPLSYYKNRDYACFFSANSTQKPALYDTAGATANSRINARLPYIFLLSRIAHYLKLIQRENIGTTKDRRLLELELNTWVRSLVTEMTDPGDELQASHPLRDAKVVVEDIEDNPGFFRVKLYAVPHFQVEGMDVNLSLVSQMPKAKS